MGVRKREWRSFSIYMHCHYDSSRGVIRHIRSYMEWRIECFFCIAFCVVGVISRGIRLHRILHDMEIGGEKMKGLHISCTVILLCIVLGILFNLWAYTRPLIDVLVVLGSFALCLMILLTVLYFNVKRKMKSKG